MQKQHIIVVGVKICYKVRRASGREPKNET